MPDSVLDTLETQRSILFVHSNIHSVNIYRVRIYCAPTTELSVWSTTMSKTLTPAIYSLVRQTDIKCTLSPTNTHTNKMK